MLHFKLLISLGAWFDFSQTKNHEMFWALDFLFLIYYVVLCFFFFNVFLKWGISITFTVALLIFRAIMQPRDYGCLRNLNFLGMFFWDHNTHCSLMSRTQTVTLEANINKINIRAITNQKNYHYWNTMSPLKNTVYPLSSLKFYKGQSRTFGDSHCICCVVLL